MPKSKRAKQENEKSFFQRNSANAWVNSTPDVLKPYLLLLRADKPIGTWLFYFPCIFSISLATPPGELPSLYYLGAFALFSFLIRGAGCIINDVWDRDFDKQVQRTKNRPIASGKITVMNALIFLFALLIPTNWLLMTFHSSCFPMGIALEILALVYPLCKRYIWFPQLVLGFAFNMGAMMGHAAVTEEVNWFITPFLYASCIFWTLYYDTIYAFQDAADDELAGVKSTARLFSKYTAKEIRKMSPADRLKEEKSKRLKYILLLLSFAVGHIVLFTFVGMKVNLNGTFYLFVALAAVEMMHQLLTLDMNNRAACGQAFLDTKWHAVILSLGIIIAIRFDQTMSALRF